MPAFLMAIAFSYGWRTMSNLLPEQYANISYTHLDVYKRQELTCAHIKAHMDVFHRWLGSAFDAGAVSYTHLDVYKRQLMGGAR